MPAAPNRSYHTHFVIIFLLISLNLRLAFSAANPLLASVMRDLGLNVESGALFGLLPIMALGVAAPLGSKLVSYVRPRRLIVYALFCAVSGVVMRSYGGVVGLYTGTLIIGLGLGVTGSVILGIVKQVFPQNIPALMGGYTACVSLGTSIGSGAAAPMASILGGWQAGLLFWGLPLLLSTLLWMELIHRNHRLNITHTTLNAPIAPLLRQPKAWSVSLFYLFRVAGAWLIIVWLSTLMRQRGLTLTEAGLVLALATASEIPASLLSEHFSHWLGGRVRLMYIAIPLSVVACVGLLMGPLSWWPLFSIVFGVCIGSVFTLGMTLIVVNAADEAATVALSGMAQGMGFVLGGVLAWAASGMMQLPDPHLRMSGAYALFALFGLIFGIYSSRPGLVQLPAQSPTAKETI